MIISLIISVIIIILCIYIILNLRNKVVILEQKVLEDKINVDTIYKNVLATQKILKEIDFKGIFEKDDDVGIAFSNIKHTIELLKDTFNIKSEDSIGNKDKKEKTN